MKLKKQLITMGGVIGASIAMGSSIVATNLNPSENANANLSSSTDNNVTVENNNVVNNKPNTNVNNNTGSNTTVNNQNPGINSDNKAKLPYYVGQDLEIHTGSAIVNVLDEVGRWSNSKGPTWAHGSYHDPSKTNPANLSKPEEIGMWVYWHGRLDVWTVKADQKTVTIGANLETNGAKFTQPPIIVEFKKMDGVFVRNRVVAQYNRDTQYGWNREDGYKEWTVERENGNEAAEYKYQLWYPWLSVGGDRQYYWKSSSYTKQAIVVDQIHDVKANKIEVVNQTDTHADVQVPLTNAYADDTYRFNVITMTGMHGLNPVTETFSGRVGDLPKINGQYTFVRKIAKKVDANVLVQMHGEIFDKDNKKIANATPQIAILDKIIYTAPEHKPGVNRPEDKPLGGFDQNGNFDMDAGGDFDEC